MYEYFVEYFSEEGVECNQKLHQYRKLNKSEHDTIKTYRLHG